MTHPPARPGTSSVPRQALRAPWVLVVALSGAVGTAVLWAALRAAGLEPVVAVAGALVAMLVLVVPAVVLAVHSVTSARRQSRHAAALLPTLKALHKDVSRVHWTVQQLRETREAVPTSHSTAPAQEPSDSAQPGPRSPLSPRLVESISVAPVDARARSGRAAAAAVADARTDAALASLLDGQFELAAPVVALIGSAALREHLATVGEVQEVRPGYGSAPALGDAAYLLVEDRALRSGAWTGADDAVGTHLYRQLYGLMSHARRTGVVVVWVPTLGRTSHYTHSLRSVSTVTLDTQSTPTAPLPAWLRHVTSYVAGAKHG